MRRAASLALFCLAGILLAWVATGLIFVPFGSAPLAGEDHSFILVQAREILNHSSSLYNRDLGFPEGADKRYFPTLDYLSIPFMWIGAALSGNVFDTVQIYYLLSVAALFSFCFLSMIYLGIGRIPGFAASLAYCLLPFAATRYWGHDYYAPYYVAPFGAALAIRIGRLSPSQPVMSALRQHVLAPVPLLMMGLIALRVFYFAFFSCFLVCVAGVLASIRARSSVPFCVAAVQSCMMATVLILSMIPYLTTGHPMPERSPSDQPGAAIRIPDALGQLPPLIQPPSYATYISGERGKLEGADFWPGSILSLVILAAPLAILAAALSDRGATPKDHPQRRHDILLALALITASLLFALPNGYGYLFNMLVTGAIRSQNRIGVFTAFLALFILASSAEGLAHYYPRRRGLALGTLVCVLGLNALPQIGYAARAYDKAKDDPKLQAGNKSVMAALAALHEGNAHAVLQLPVMGWPEQPPLNGVSPYDYLWFYILDAPRSPMKWSYGLDVHQPFYQDLLEWEVDLQIAPSAKTWLPFQCTGYDAVVIDRKAEEGVRTGSAGTDPAAREQQLVDSLGRLGSKTLYEDERHAVLTLPPATETCPMMPSNE